MFSKRTDGLEEENRLTERLRERRSAGRPVLDLTVSNPTRVGLDAAYRAAYGGVGNALPERYAPEPAGALGTRQAVAAELARIAGAGDGRLPVDPRRIVLTTGTSEAYGFLVKALLDPGDRLLAPSPSYPLIELLAGLEGAQVVPYRLVDHGGFEIDLEEVRRELERGARAVFLVHPNNPTGHYVKRDELRAIVGMCADHGVPIVVDEVFYDYAHRESVDRAPSTAGLAGATTFTLNGLSKLAGLPQAKLSWIAVSGPGADRAVARLTGIADAYLGVGAAVQEAAAELLRAAPVVRAAILERVQASLERVDDAIESGAPFGRYPVEGGWSAVLTLPSFTDDEDWACRLLERRGVLVQPGYLYDIDREACAVVSLLTPPRALEEGLARVASEIERAL